HRAVAQAAGLGDRHSESETLSALWRADSGDHQRGVGNIPVGAGGSDHDGRPEPDGEGNSDRGRQRLEASATQRWITVPGGCTAPASLAHARRLRNGRGHLVPAPRPVLLDAACHRRPDGLRPAVVDQWQEGARSLPALHRRAAYAGGEASTGDNTESSGVPAGDHGASTGFTDSGTAERSRLPRMALRPTATGLCPQYSV